MSEGKKINDCEVCKRLIKEKHKHDFLWKIACIIFVASTVIFACLYFGSNAITTTTEITIESSTVENGGDNESIIIGDGEVVKGTVEKTDYTPIICISVLAGTILLVCGGIIVADHNKKDN